jgi:hypothetical protein
MTDINVQSSGGNYFLQENDDGSNDGRMMLSTIHVKYEPLNCQLESGLPDGSFLNQIHQFW